VHLTEECQRLLAAQQGVATTAQLLAAGVSQSALRRRVARGWRLVLPRVVATFVHPPDQGQRLLAACLYAGEDAAIASLAAATWHGVHAADGDPRIQVLVPADRDPASMGFVIVRPTRRMDVSPWQRGALRVVSPPRAVIDAARDAAGSQRAEAIVIEAAQRRLVSVEQLRHELEAGARQGSRQVRRAVQAAEAGAWSVPEAELARLCTDSKVLPPLLLNPDLIAADGTRLPRPDAWIDEVGLAVQVHSRRYHSGSLDWEATVMSDGIFAEHAIPVLGITPTALLREPRAVLGRIERAYLAARRRPRPAVTAIPTGHGGVDRIVAAHDPAGRRPIRDAS